MRHTTGTLPQAELLIKLRERAGKPRRDRDEYIQLVLASPQEDVQRAIRSLNEKLGFEPDAGGPHPNQMRLGRQLESELRLPEDARADWGCLTRQQADARIKQLIQDKRAGE